MGGGGGTSWFSACMDGAACMHTMGANYCECQIFSLLYYMYTETVTMISYRDKVSKGGWFGLSTRITEAPKSGRGKEVKMAPQHGRGPAIRTSSKIRRFTH